MSKPDLARSVDAAQSILATATLAAEQARRLERALAEGAADIAQAMARLDPSSGAAALEIAGGFAIFAGAGSPLTQGLGMGLTGPVGAAELDAMEAHLRRGLPQGHGSVQLEICPFVDPSLPALLAERGYRVHEWQLVWTCALDEAPREPQQPRHAPDAQLSVRRVREGEEETYLRAILAGFLESEDVPEDALALMRPTTATPRHEAFLALLGDTPAGGGALSYRGEIAFISGSGVRPAFRRHGAQAALLRARLARARELGCRVACSSTLPGTSSRRNMERAGFHVAYPKLVMLRG